MKKENEKLPKSTHQGSLKLGEGGEYEIRCYNLDNGERVLSREALLRALGRTGNPKYKEEKELFSTPVFLRANNLKPFIPEDLVTSSEAIVFETEGGKKTYGYKAEILPSVCYVYIDAEAKNKLTPAQKIVARKCHILVRGFAKVGIIALVDEATGYQYERERDELHKILKAYISEELLKWERKFPDVFYQELFRLNDWDFTVSGIKKRPGVIGTWTNRLIYEQLPKGVLDELKKRTPKSPSGHYTRKFFQSLTFDIGQPHLTAQINQVVTLFMLSDTMKDMWQKFRKLKNRQAGQLELPFKFDEKGHTKEPIYEEDKLSDFNKKLKTALEFNPNKN
ncbi:MAG: P63C domain-containing protein [Ignavibacteriaceae bacterium]